MIDRHPGRMHSGRRRLLQGAAAFTALGLGLPQVHAQRRTELILGGGGYVDPANGARKWVFAAVDLASGNVRRTDSSFFPHGIAIHPQSRERLFVFEKIGTGACEINLSSMEVVRPIPLHEGHAFYGHGAVSADGTLLYSTETRASDGSGVIAVRSTATLEYIGEFPSHGDHPHDCRLIDGGRVMVVTNGGGTEASGHHASLAYVDVKTRRLLRRFDMPGESFNAGHLAVAGETAVVVSAPRRGLPNDRPGAVSVRSPGGGLVTMTRPAEVVARMQGESLSVAVHVSGGLFGVTHPDGNMVTFWTLRRPRLLKVLELPRPRGIALTLDRSRFIISYGPQTNLVQVSVGSLVPDEATRVGDTYLGGSHIVNWNSDG